MQDFKPVHHRQGQQDALSALYKAQVVHFLQVQIMQALEILRGAQGILVIIENFESLCKRNLAIMGYEITSVRARPACRASSSIPHRASLRDWLVNSSKARLGMRLQEPILQYGNSRGHESKALTS